MANHGSLPQQITRFIIVGVGATWVHWGTYLLINHLFGLTEERPFGLQRFLPPPVETFPRLLEPEALLPLPVFCVVIPVNFLLVRFFLTREPNAQDSAA